jgi:flagellar biogenesis protein FliO
MDQVVAVVTVLALLGATLWILRRRGAIRLRGGRPRMICVLDSRPLAPGHILHVVEVPGRTLVIETHPSGCTLLDSSLIHSNPREHECSASR